MGRNWVRTANPVGHWVRKLKPERHEPGDSQVTAARATYEIPFRVPARGKQELKRQTAVGAAQVSVRRCSFSQIREMWRQECFDQLHWYSACCLSVVQPTPFTQRLSLSTPRSNPSIRRNARYTVQTKSNTLQLDVSRKAKISFKDKIGKLDTLKPGQKVKVDGVSKWWRGGLMRRGNGRFGPWHGQQPQIARQGRISALPQYVWADDTLRESSVALIALAGATSLSSLLRFFRSRGSLTSHK